MNCNITSMLLTAILMKCIAAPAQTNYLDPDFGTGGIVTTPLFTARALAQQQDGKLLVAGSVQNAAPGFTMDYIVYRFNTDGSPDTTFGTEGKVHLERERANYIIGIKQLEDGKILAVGSTQYMPPSNPWDPGQMIPSNRIQFLRFNPDGNIDTTFGNNGFFNTATVNVARPANVVFLPNGKFVVVGQYNMFLVAKPVIARFNADMSNDNSFNGTGSVKHPQLAGSFNGAAVTVDGSIITALKQNGDITLFKYFENGLPDNSFGNNGQMTVDFGSTDDTLNDIIVTDEGQLLLTGSISGAVRSAVLVRLQADGTLDTSYGDSGKFLLSNDTGNNENAVQSISLNGGRIITGLRKWNNAADYGLLFTTNSGIQDSPIGDNGQVITSLENNQNLSHIMQQEDGKIIAAGFDDNNMVLMRYEIPLVLGNTLYEYKQITVYPNPCMDRVTISSLPEGTTISLYNVSGQKLFDSITAHKEFQIDLTNLPKGIYFLNSTQGSAKIIKE